MSYFPSTPIVGTGPGDAFRPGVRDSSPAEGSRHPSDVRKGTRTIDHDRKDGSEGGVSGTHASSVQMHPTVRHAVESILLEERTRWAMQIHDGLTQSVTSAVLELQTFRHRIAGRPGGRDRVAPRGRSRDPGGPAEDPRAAVRDDQHAGGRPRSSLWSFGEARRRPVPTTCRSRATSIGAGRGLRVAHAIVSEALVERSEALRSGRGGRARARGRAGDPDRDRGSRDAASPRCRTTTHTSECGSCGPVPSPSAGPWTLNRPPDTAPRVSAVLPVGGRGDER